MLHMQPLWFLDSLVSPLRFSLPPPALCASDQWEAYLKHGEGLQLTYNCMERTVVKDLVKLGYTVPSRRTLVDTLTAGLEPLCVVSSDNRGQHGETTLCFL